jgi:hypothetical protein
LSGFTSSTGPVYGALSSFLPTKDPPPPAGYPKAYLNWIFLDDQFNYVSSSRGSVQAASTTYPAATLNTVAPGAPIPISKNGWQNHNTADIAYNTVALGITLFVEISNPLGWGALIFEGLYFVGNEYYKSKHNGESITEAMFDK